MNLSLWREREPVGSVNGGLARLRDEMDRTFNRFFTAPFSSVEPGALRSEDWIPPLDVSEGESEVTVRAEVPGIAAKDLVISVSGNTLSIAGTKEEKDERKGEDFYQCERRFGSFKRVVDLPETADFDKVTAESDNGIVTIRVAKKPGAKPKLVEVKPAGKKALVSA